MVGSPDLIGQRREEIYYRRKKVLGLLCRPLLSQSESGEVHECVEHMTEVLDHVRVIRRYVDGHASCLGQYHGPRGRYILFQYCQFLLVCGHGYGLGKVHHVCSEHGLEEQLRSISTGKRG